jgi:hypothetical protein
MVAGTGDNRFLVHKEAGRMSSPAYLSPPCRNRTPMRTSVCRGTELAFEPAVHVTRLAGHSRASLLHIVGARVSCCKSTACESE